MKITVIADFGQGANVAYLPDGSVVPNSGDSIYIGKMLHWYKVINRRIIYSDTECKVFLTVAKEL